MQTIRRIALFLVVFSLGLSQPVLAASLNVANGNLYDEQSVSPLPKLPVTIAYNSRATRVGMFGYGWSANIDVRLLINTSGSVVMVDGDGKERLFTPSGGTAFTAAPDVHDILTLSNGLYRLDRKGGGYVGFSATGQPTEIVDKNGNAVTFSYVNKPLAELTGQTGEKIQVATNANGRITQLVDATGKSTSFTYDSTDNLTAITDPAGQKQQFIYNADHNLTAKTNPAGQTTTYNYDTSDRISSSVDAAGLVRTVAYSGAVTKFTDSMGAVTEYTTDTNQHIISKKDSLGRVSTITWDEQGNRTSITDATGTVYMTYDGNGNLLTRTDHLGKTTSYVYDAQNHLLSITSPTGDTTSFTYDASGNRLTSTDPMGNITSYAYDSKGQIVAIINAQGRTTSLYYDSAGNLVRIVDPNNASTSLTYDASGNVVTLTDASGNTRTFAYDLLNRLVSAKDPLGNTTSHGYDVLGNRTATLDANGNQSEAAYDQRNRVIQLIDALGQTTELYYNEEGGDRGDNKPTAVTDAAGHTTWFNYDSLGRVIREIDHLGRQTNLQYDAAGNLTSRTDAMGRTITYSYDGLGRLLQKSGSDGSVATFQYDARGRLSYASNQNIAYTLTYDTLGRLTGISDSNKRTISYQYDGLGNRTRMTMPDGGAVGYTYDAANRLSRMASFLGEFSFGYDNLGNRTKLTYPNGVTTNYGYDPAGRLTAILAQGRGATVNSFNYTHDAVGNRLSKTEQQKERATRYNYAYDATYQLTQSLPTVLREDKERGDEKDKRNEHDSDSRRGQEVSEGHHEHTRNHRAENFVYGAVGNRLRGPGHADASVYNELNQLLANKTEEFRYDANGNLIYKAGLADDDEDDYEQQGWSYEYDLENRLTKASKIGDHGSRSISFKYDPFGRRIEKKVEETGHHRSEARITTYVYDNEDIILEISGKNTSRYVHGPGIDEPLAMEQKRNTYFFHADGLGSIVNLTDQRGRVVQSYEYSSFGRMKEHGGEMKQPYGFTGREWDKELGLYYYRARYYDPKGGRFISKDPIGFAGRDVNLYRYVRNDPANFVDPDGLLRIPGAEKAIGWGLKRLAKTLGGKLGEKIGEWSGFFDTEIAYPPEEQEMDKDSDKDGTSDYWDNDDDNDGIPDDQDETPKGPNDAEKHCE
ncbi:MAG: RHS repeat-associated core domain-containing protein [Desulfobulbia bacterium]